MATNNTKARAKLAKARGGHTDAIAHGWNDYAKGLPFRAEYGAADELWQRHYEMGRAEAAAASAVDTLPILRRNRSIQKELARCTPAQWEQARVEMNYHADRRAA